MTVKELSGIVGNFDCAPWLGCDQKQEIYLKVGSVSLSNIGNNHKIDYSINSDTMRVMVKVLEILKLMRNNPKGIRFNDLCKVCDKYFG